jgi:hypothetical protein
MKIRQQQIMTDYKTKARDLRIRAASPLEIYQYEKLPT